MATSSESTGSFRLQLPTVRVTSANPCAFLKGVPPNITSSIFEQRKVLVDCSPNTHLIASLILLFPLQFGPTTAVIPGPNDNFVFSGKVLNPCKVNDFNNTVSPTNFNPNTVFFNIFIRFYFH